MSRWLGVALIALTGLLPSLAGGVGDAAPQPPRIAVMVLENRSYGQVIGNPRAPFLNSLARRGALATRYFAVTHPSLPNYLAMTTGGHAEVTSNCAHCGTDGRSLVNQLDAAKIGWRAYFESLPRRLSSPYSRLSLYNRHYNPFVYTDTLKPADLAGAHITSFQGLRSDLAHKTLPAFSWIAPNTRHDGHSASLHVTDRFAAALVPRIERALGPRGVLFIAWDEGRKSDQRGLAGRGGGRVALLAVGPGAAHGARVAVRANHYALLHTIESRLGLSSLGRAGRAPVLKGLLAA